MPKLLREIAEEAASDMSEAEYRRLRQLRSDMRAEGCPEWMIERNATPETARKMVAYEKKVLKYIMFGDRI